MGSAMKGGEILALFGPLGAGKTALVRGMAAGLDAPSTAVSSPTFVLIHEYHGRLPLAHVDLYRLPSARDIESIGLQEYLTGPTVAAIEWADKGLTILPSDRLEIILRHASVESRTITMTATGPCSRDFLGRIRQVYARRTQRDTGRPPGKKKKAAP